MMHATNLLLAPNSSGLGTEKQQIQAFTFEGLSPAGTAGVLLPEVSHMFTGERFAEKWHLWGFENESSRAPVIYYWRTHNFLLALHARARKISNAMKAILARKWLGGLCEFAIIILAWSGFVVFTFWFFGFERFMTLDWLGGGVSISLGMGIIWTTYFYCSVVPHFKKTIPLEEFRMAHILFQSMLIAFYVGLLFIEKPEVDTFMAWFVGAIYFILGCPTCCALNFTCDAVPMD